MNERMVIELGQQAMFTILILASPMLVLGLLVGLAVSIFRLQLRFMRLPWPLFLKS